MPRKAIEIPAELESAADQVLEQGISMPRARDLFNYALMSRAIKREGGNQTETATKLGMTKQGLAQYLQRLEVRLSA